MAGIVITHIFVATIIRMYLNDDGNLIEPTTHPNSPETKKAILVYTVHNS